jgi:hypothetical protein
MLPRPEVTEFSPDDLPTEFRCVSAFAPLMAAAAPTLPAARTAARTSPMPPPGRPSTPPEFDRLVVRPLTRPANRLAPWPSARPAAAQTSAVRGLSQPSAGAAATGAAVAPAAPGLELTLLARFQQLMAAEGLPVQLARMGYDRLYARDRLTLGCRSNSEPLLQLSRQLWRLYDERPGGSAALH